MRSTTRVKKNFIGGYQIKFYSFCDFLLPGPGYAWTRNMPIQKKEFMRQKTPPGLMPGGSKI